MILEMNLEIFFGIILKIFFWIFGKSIENIFFEIIFEKYLRNETNIYIYIYIWKVSYGNVRNLLLISLESLD